MRSFPNSDDSLMELLIITLWTETPYKMLSTKNGGVFCMDWNFVTVVLPEVRFFLVLVSLRRPEGVCYENWCIAQITAFMKKCTSLAWSGSTLLAIPIQYAVLFKTNSSISRTVHNGNYFRCPKIWIFYGTPFKLSIRHLSQQAGHWDRSHEQIDQYLNKETKDRHLPVKTPLCHRLYLTQKPPTL